MELNTVQQPLIDKSEAKTNIDEDQQSSLQNSDNQQQVSPFSSPEKAEGDTEPTDKQTDENVRASVLSQRHSYKRANRSQNIRLQDANKKFNWNLYQRILQYTKQEWPLFSTAQASLVISSVGQTFLPYLTGQLLDKVAFSKDYDDIKPLVYLYLMTMVLTGIFVCIRLIAISYLGEQILVQMRRDVFSHFVNCDVEFFQSHKTAQLISRLGSDISTAKAAATNNITFFLRNLLTCIGNTIMLLYLSWKLSLVVMVIIPLYGISSLIYTKKAKLLSKLYQEVVADCSEICQETFSGILTVKSFHGEQKELKRYEEKLEEARTNGKTGAVLNGIYSFVTFMLSNIGILTVLWYGGYLVIHEQPGLTSGNLASFILYTTSLASNASSISNSLSSIVTATGALERIFEMLQYQPKIKNQGGVPVNDFTKQIQFQNVNFKYPKSDVVVLQDFNLTIQQGDYVAFVGPSGSGQSTIIKLIERFYDPTSGAVFLDELDYKDIYLPSLRKWMGFVSQEPILFSGSIMENLLYGVQNQGEVTQQEIDQTCKMAGAFQFINDTSRFPDRYETVVGEKGTKLSGGQQQRVAIARALLQKPKILVFDEATSALDSESEYLVQKAIDNLISKTKLTIIIIAHRLSTIVNCKKIVVMQQGSIVETGTHHQLLQQNGIYKNLVQKQLHGGKQVAN